MSRMKSNAVSFGVYRLKKHYGRIDCTASSNTINTLINTNQLQWYNFMLINFEVVFHVHNHCFVCILEEQKWKSGKIKTIQFKSKIKC